MADYSDTVSRTRQGRDGAFQASEANSVVSTPERVIDACSNAVQCLTKAMITGACCIGGVYLLKTVSAIAKGVNSRQQERQIRRDARYYLMKGKEDAVDVDSITISDSAGQYSNR